MSNKYKEEEIRQSQRIGLISTTIGFVFFLGSSIYYEYQLKNLRQEKFLEAKKMLSVSKPLTDTVYNLKINGHDTLKEEKIDTVSWIVPNSVLR